ncbi:hypothetical protein JOB18_017544 [Solea senegalensis]|uniref:Uncharacterized protein n=1 Tax=Solea senegalensis TaxID=28829 RepID=A0AAV6PTX2_SOLSE|nr:hypothetical protein JOB18_017544 [Solea senegalensis]
MHSERRYMESSIFNTCYTVQRPVVSFVCANDVVRKEKAENLQPTRCPLTVLPPESDVELLAQGCHSQVAVLLRHHGDNPPSFSAHRVPNGHFHNCAVMASSVWPEEKQSGFVMTANSSQGLLWTLCCCGETEEKDARTLHNKGFQTHNCVVIEKL